MRKRAAKIIEFVKTHKIAAIVGTIIFLVAILTVPKRVLSYLKGPTLKLKNRISIKQFRLQARFKQKTKLS